MGITSLELMLRHQQYNTPKTTQRRVCKKKEIAIELFLSLSKIEYKLDLISSYVRK